MRKIAYGVASAAALAVVIGSLFVVFGGVHHPATATAQAQAADIVNVRALENKLDIKKLPVRDVPGGED